MIWRHKPRPSDTCLVRQTYASKHDPVDCGKRAEPKVAAGQKGHNVDLSAELQADEELRGQRDPAIIAHLPKTANQGRNRSPHSPFNLPKVYRRRRWSSQIG